MGFLEEWLNDRGNTHYPGCESDHIRCAVAAEIDRLTAELDVAESNMKHLAADLVESENRARAMEEELIRERDEARALAVWAVRVGASLLDPRYHGNYLELILSQGDLRRITYDGTDAGILDALRRAKEASNGD